MFSRKNRSSADPPTPLQLPCSPLPRLQQLTLLESQLISILGRRNIAVDDSSDIFTRLEDIYLSSLQGSPLGMEALEKCLRVLGTCDSPARVRFLYLCAHQMVLKGAATDELQPVLLEAFHSGLALKHKVDLGFKAGLAFCQVSEHAAEVDKILSSLVVALEQELGYRPQRRPKQNPHPHASSTISGSISHEATKAIYLGTSSLPKTAPNKTHPHGRGQKLELFKLLFEAFVTGSWRIQSQAKRKYYAHCGEELKARLIREYPGRELQKKLGKIEQRRCVALGELSTVIHWGMHSPEPVEESFPKGSFPNRQAQPQVDKKTRGNLHSKSTTKKQQVRSKSQAASSSMGLQSLKSSFIKDTHGSTWNTPTPTPGHSRQPSFKLHIRRSSKLKLENRNSSERQTGGKEDEGSTVKPEVTKLVFRESSENIPPSYKQKDKLNSKPTVPAEGGKSIKLKFDRLHYDKPEVKKKKLRHAFNWDKQKQKPQKENQLQKVLDIKCLPQIKQQSSIQKDATLDPHSPHSPLSPHSPHSPHQSPIISPDHSLTHPSVGDLNSASRIDLLLKQGVEWIAYQQSQPPSRQAISNAVLSQCQMLSPPRHDQSFSDTKLMSEYIMEEQEEASREASYKIVIKTLEKPEANMIIEEVEAYLKRLGEGVVLREVGKEQQMAQSRMEIRKEETTVSKRQNKMMRPNRPSRMNTNSPSEVSIQIRRQTQQKPEQSHEDSDCDEVEVASKIMTEDKLNSYQHTNNEEEALIQDEGDNFLPLDLVVQEVNEYFESMAADEPQPKITMDFIKSSKQEELQEVAQQIADLTQAIVQKILQQSQAESPSPITEQALPSFPTQQQPQSSPSSKHYVPALPLSRLKCSIEAEQPSLSQSGSVDDKQLSSQIQSCPSIDQPHLPPLADTNPHIDPDNTDPDHQMQLLSPSVQGEERQGSHFTCSRFLGSKIDTQKQIDFQWRSQMNFINEIFKTDQIASEQNRIPVALPLPLLQIPEQHRRDNRLHLQQSQTSQNQRSNYRSRTQSQISNKSSKDMRGESASSRSLRKEKSNVCLSFSYSDNYEGVTHTSKRFNHWLCPELKVDNNQFIFMMESKGTQLKREIVVPSFVVVNDDTIRQVSAKVQSFLGRFPLQKQLGAEEIADIGRQLQTVDLLPDEVQLPSLTITGTDRQQDKLKCMASLKSLRIVIQSTKLFLRVNPIAIHSLPELQSAVSSLSPQKFIIRNGQILPRGFYTFTGQRNIKLREKSEGAVNHLIFDVLERFSEKEEFDYCVREQSGESLTFQGVTPARRGKILKNMDTIIGFCLKTVQGKAKLNGSNLKQFLTLL